MGAGRGSRAVQDGGRRQDLEGRADHQREHGRGGRALDPSNPDIVYASAYQRRRHVFTLIDGGPESAIYKSTDAGARGTS